MLAFLGMCFFVLSATFLTSNFVCFNRTLLNTDILLSASFVAILFLFFYLNGVYSACSADRDVFTFETPKKFSVIHQKIVSNEGVRQH